jgi:hypothetical protein
VSYHIKLYLAFYTHDGKEIARETLGIDEAASLEEITERSKRAAKAWQSPRESQSIESLDPPEAHEMAHA